jgi:signal transduction histidine kinase
LNALALELSCRYLSPLLGIAEERGIAVDKLAAAWGIEVAQLHDQTNWVSLRFYEALTEFIAERTGAEALQERVTRSVFSPQAAGFLYPFLRAFGSPRLLYARLPQVVQVMNKVSQVRVISLRRGEALVEYRPSRPEHVERSPLVCLLRRAQLAAGPVLWALPPARVEELECQNRGDGRCLYRIRWTHSVGVLGAAVGTVVGLAAGIACGGGPAVAAAALVGALAGRLWDQRRQVAQIRRFNEEQTRALEDAAAAAERRFIELEKAKSEVDRQVEVRTSELQRTTAHLERLSRVKDEFVANVSHELRTPLTLILGPLEDLISGRGKADAAAHLETMYRNTLRLSGMLNDLLDLSRLQAGQLRLALAELDLSEAVTQVVDQYRPLAERKGITLVLANSGPVSVRGDGRRLHFAFVNLLSNALKFTPAGGAVRVGLRATEETVSVEVADTGPGIAPDLQSRVFDRFERFEAPGAPGAAGAGIGLALVKELIELHGGRVVLCSVPGQGATFTVLLPRQGPGDLGPEVEAADIPLPGGEEPTTWAPVAGTVPLALSQSEAATAAPSVAAEVQVGAPCILVVEDHDDMRAFIVRALRRRYQVVEAADAALALAILERTRPDAILSDVMMPGMNGYELCRRVKAASATRTVPVILVTAQHDARRLIEGFESGADDYVVKPFSCDELLARLDLHLRLRQLMEEQLLTEKLAALGTVAAGLAHEVRNPLSAMLTGLPRLRREILRLPLHDEVRKMLDIVGDSADRINQAISNVIEAVQPDHVGPKPTDIRSGLEVAIRMLAHRTPAGVELRRRFEHTRIVLAYRAALNQVFINVLDNALRAVGDHGVIEISTRDETHGVVITVADSGPGVLPELAARIFDPFFTTRPAGEGSGLGLYLSRRIIRSCGGTLGLVSAPGWGACFRIQLPSPAEEVSHGS